MTSSQENLRRWRIVAGETRALLLRNAELLTRRAALLQTAVEEFHDVIRLTRDFVTNAGGGGAEITSSRYAPPAVAGNGE